MASQLSLLGQRKFGPLFGAQFFGAFNDNVFKNSIGLYLTYTASQSISNADVLVNEAAAIFVLPFFLFSSLAGEITDKWDKARVLQITKFCEIIFMILGFIGFYYLNINLLFFILFLLGAHATFFGPAKYSILPQLLKENELIAGNGLIEGGTFLAILLGTICAGHLIERPNGPVLVGIFVIIFAVIGFIFSMGIPKAPATTSAHIKVDWNIIRSTWRNLKLCHENQTVFTAILGISWFWFYGAFFLTQFPHYAKNYLNGDTSVFTLLLMIFSISIGLGSMLCNYLGRGNIELGLVPFGSIGLSIFAIDLAFASGPVPAETLTYLTFFSVPANYHVVFDIMMIGIFSGFYTVPLYALTQNRAKEEERSRTISGMNIINSIFMVMAAVLTAYYLKRGFSLNQLFVLVGLFNAVVAIYIYKLIPEFLFRFLCWMLIHSIYRVSQSDTHHIPETGPALLICNHVSYVDPMIIMAVSPRPIRFVMDYNIFNAPLLKFIFEQSGAIPIATERESPEVKEKAFVTIVEALKAGELVAIFPEGGITRTGNIEPFKSGVERIVRETGVNVIPMALQGLWGSFFSRKHGKAMFHIPRFIPFRKISLNAARPVEPQDVTKEKLQAIVEKLRGYWK